MWQGLRIGTGIDVHALKENVPLFLGGLRIPYERGLEGHSDGDALIHAIVDAIFGALRVGDLGQHFPSSDDKWKGAASREFLLYAARLLKEKDFEILYIDSTLMAQAPILKPYIPEMIQVLATALSCPEDRISVKATTTDHLGFVGRKEGIAAQAVCLLKPTGAM